MEWFDAVKTWLTDNAIVLGALVAVLALVEYFLKPYRSFFKRTNGIRDNAFVEKVYDDLREARAQRDDYATAAQYLQSELHSAQGENKGLKKAIADLVAKESPQADDAIEHLRRGDTDQAKRLYRQIGEAKANEGTAANKEAAEAYVNLSAIAFLTDTVEALAASAKATELDPDNAGAWNQLGQLQNWAGNLNAAENSHNRVLALGKSTNDTELEAIALSNLGIIADTRGELDAAEDFYKRALTLNEELGRKEGIAINLANLGLIDRTRGDLDAAEDYQNRALALHKELGYKEGTAIALGNLGVIAKIRGDLDKAEDFQTQALALKEELGRKQSIATTLANLGSIAETRGDRATARELWIQALDLYADIGLPHMVKRLQGWIDSLPEKNSD